MPAARSAAPRATAASPPSPSSTSPARPPPCCATRRRTLANALWRRSCTGEITGPEALSFTEVAETLSAATGRRIRYVDETLEEARRSRAHFGAPDWQLEGWITTYTAIARGEHAHVSHDVELLTGRTPISLRELVLH